MLVTLALALAAPWIPAGQVFVVDDDGGPGVDFADLGSAIAAALPGDTVLVRDGTYAAYDTTPGQAWFEIVHGITVVAEAGANVKLITPVHVIGPATGDTVHLRGLTIDMSGWLNANGLRTLVHVGAFGDPRRLVVEECVLRPAVLNTTSASSSGWGFDAISLQSSECVLRGVSVVAGGTLVFDSSLPGFLGSDHPLRAVNSTVHVYDSEILAASTGNVLEPTILLQGSQLFLSGSRVVGANGFNGSGFTCGGSGLPAVRVVPGGLLASSVTVLDSELLGGTAGSPATGCFGNPVTDGPPVDLQAGTFVQLDGGARVLEGPRTAVESAASALVLAGEPGDLVVLGVSAGPSSPLALPFLTGALHLAPPSPLLVIGAVDAAGTLTWPFVVPPVGPSADANAATLQAFVLDAGGGLTASAPVRLTFLSDSL